MSDTLETGDGMLKDTYPKGKKMAEKDGWKRKVLEFLFTSEGKPEGEGSHSLLEERKRKIDEAAEAADFPNKESEVISPGFKKAKEKK